MTNALDLWWQHNLKMTLIHHVFWLSKDFYKMESGWKNVWSCLLFSPTFNAFQDPEHSSSPDTWHHGKIVKIGKLSNSIFRNIKSPPDVQNCQNYCLSDTFLNILLYRYIKSPPHCCALAVRHVLHFLDLSFVQLERRALCCYCCTNVYSERCDYIRNPKVQLEGGPCCDKRL